MLNGAVASLLSTIVMAFGNSYVFVSFYKTMILVFVLSVLHSIVFLPVLLSFVGPRRTSRPRTTVAHDPGRSGLSIRGTNCVGSGSPTPPSPTPQECAGPSLEMRHVAEEVAPSEGSHRTSLFAGERDSLSGHETRPGPAERQANSEARPRPVDRIEES